MADEEIRTEEEPEVEGHGLTPGEDKTEIISPGAQAEDSDDVEAHVFLAEGHGGEFLAEGHGGE